VWLPFIEVATQTDMTIGEGEKGLALRQAAEVESLLADAPLLNGKVRTFDHLRPPIPVPVGTTSSAL
jgi:hypothetical protein